MRFLSLSLYFFFVLVMLPLRLLAGVANSVIDWSFYHFEMNMSDWTNEWVLEEDENPWWRL